MSSIKLPNLSCGFSQTFFLADSVRRRARSCLTVCQSDGSFFDRAWCRYADSITWSCTRFTDALWLKMTHIWLSWGCWVTNSLGTYLWHAWGMTVEHVEGMIAERVSLTRHTDRMQDNVVVGWAITCCGPIWASTCSLLLFFWQHLFTVNSQKLAKQPDRGSTTRCNSCWKDTGSFRVSFQQLFPNNLCKVGKWTFLVQVGRQTIVRHRFLPWS